MESFRCEACAKSFTGLVCFQQHEASEKHKKKVRLMNGVTFEMPKPVNPDQFHCPVCMVSISGLDNYQKHVISLDHALKVQQKNGDLLSQSVSDTFELKTERNQLVESTGSLTNPIKTVAPFAECKPCQKQFSGPEPYQQHLVSAGHKKKCGTSNDIVQSHEMNFSIRNEKVDSNSLSDPQSSASGCEIDKIAPQPFARCDICVMQFSGPVPYQMHLVSESHKKKAGGYSLETSLAESQSTFKCDICVMMFTGPVPYQQHLVSNGHNKKMNAAELSKQLATSGSLSPPDSTVSDTYLGLGQSSMNDPKWYCDICKKQCSGPIPYNSHISSRDHSKNLRIRVIEENLRKIKEADPLTHVGNHEIDTSLPSQVTSADLNLKVKSEMEESTVEFKTNDLNINVKNVDLKILSDKFQLNENDLIALPNLNIIPPEKLDVTVFGPNDEVVLSSLKKRQEFLSEMKEEEKVCNNENNCFMVE